MSKEPDNTSRDSISPAWPAPKLRYQHPKEPSNRAKEPYNK